jgi:hypothetical protein
LRDTKETLKNPTKATKNNNHQSKNHPKVKSCKTKKGKRAESFRKTS